MPSNTNNAQPNAEAAPDMPPRDQIQRVPRRYKLLKKSQLYHGNLILDCLVPQALLDKCPSRDAREFTHMRYSAVTCDPDHFKDSHFTIRQLHYEPPRRTELLIGITMSNEDEELFSQTMYGVMKNILNLTRRRGSRVWREEAGKRVVVCIVGDGRSRIHPKTLDVLAAMGAYQEGLVKTRSNSKNVTAHIYEYTTPIPAAPSLKIEDGDQCFIPVQIVFCLKEKRQGKLNSHRWIFNAFAPILNPFVCVLLDVGTIPGPTSICQLWKAIDIDLDVGGACGEVIALDSMYGKSLVKHGDEFLWSMKYLFPRLLQKAGYSLLDVLRWGRRKNHLFTAYRYIPLQNNPKTGKGPLQKYFRHDTEHDGDGANTSAADERMLRREVVSKQGVYWTFRCIKSAYAISTT
ncbi:hypothetical protein EST38_g3830 [Candolleomyces aberdarensis]|uniref:Chitin synthase n=1 Tax=Candolleomyces aberdarensis TaxID=2316362 RepID=A0A4Q2DNZ3_9AGAR|nr:hypothetical protein EST38_g3830 [Candolleomyces aberdarensis]